MTVFFIWDECCHQAVYFQLTEPDWTELSHQSGTYFEDLPMVSSCEVGLLQKRVDRRSVDVPFRRFDFRRRRRFIGRRHHRRRRLDLVTLLSDERRNVALRQLVQEPAVAIGRSPVNDLQEIIMTLVKAKSKKKKNTRRASSIWKYWAGLIKVERMIRSKMKFVADLKKGTR